MATASQFRHQDVSAVPRGYKVRTVTHPSGHRVRVAFPPGPRHTGAGKLVSILHPKHERNPCAHNPLQELVKDSKGRQWWVNILGSDRSGFTGEGYPVSSGKIKRVGKPVLAHGRSESEAGDRLSEKMDRNPKSKTREQVEKMQAKAVRFLRDVVKDSDKADEIEGMSVAEYAEKKKIALDNPGKSKGKSKKAKGKSSSLRNRRNLRKNQAQTEAAAALYEIFHGKKPKEIIELHQDVIRREDYAALGQLVEITLPELNIALDFESDKVLLAASPNGKQMYFIGGNQDLRAVLGKLADDEKDFLDLGEVGQVVYRTRKDFDKFEENDYKHKMGEGGHEKPRAMYDKLNKQIYFVGGEYDASRHEGIVH